MNNVNFPKVTHVKSAIKAVKVSVVFLPASLPELNPIDRCWSQVNTLEKGTAPKSLMDFHNKLGEALSTVTESDCEGWFENSGIIQY